MRQVAHRDKMNLLLISCFVAVASLSIFPTKTFGTTDIQQPHQHQHQHDHDHEHHDDQHPHTEQSAVKKQQTQQTPEQPHALPLTVGAGQQNGGEVWQEDDREVLIRNERGTKNNSNGGAASASCRYVKSPWSDCDPKTNTRSRTLNLKKGEEGCVQTRTIQKKCKKACRYEKGTWSECTTGQMTRTDKLKSTSDPTCQATREVNKNCNPAKSKGDKKDRPAKNGKQDKGQRKSRA